MNPGLCCNKCCNNAQNDLRYWRRSYAIWWDQAGTGNAVWVLECWCPGESCLCWLAQWGSCAQQKCLHFVIPISFLARGAGEVCHVISGWPTEVFVCLSVSVLSTGHRSERHKSVVHAKQNPIWVWHCSVRSPTSWTFTQHHLQLLSNIKWLKSFCVFSFCLYGFMVVLL